jgi:UDP-glucose 4-epimerase
LEQILITGVAGFIGSHVARRFLREDGYRVIGVDDLSVGRPANVPPGVEFIQGDLATASTVATLPGCRKILHLAGQSSGEISFDNPVDDLRMNTVATLNLIRYGIDNRVERLVYASSMSVYGAVEDAPTSETHECRPLSGYGVGKLASEGYLRVYRNRLPSVSLRMFNVYGPGQDMSNLRQGMVSIYLAQALARGRIEVKGSLDRFRDFIFIDDVVEAWFRAATRTAALGATLNVGTGIRTTVADLLDRICALLPGCSYHTTSGTPGDQSGIYADVSSARAALGLERCTPLGAGLPRFITWARETAADFTSGLAPA